MGYSNGTWVALWRAWGRALPGPRAFTGPRASRGPLTYTFSTPRTQVLYLRYPFLRYERFLDWTLTAQGVIETGSGESRFGHDFKLMSPSSRTNHKPPKTTKTWPRDPSRSTGFVLHCRLHSPGDQFSGYLAAHHKFKFILQAKALVRSVSDRCLSASFVSMPIRSCSVNMCGRLLKAICISDRGATMRVHLPSCT